MGGDKMKALVFHGKGDLRIEEVDVPKIQKGRVKVKPVWCGICGSDLHEWIGGAQIVPVTPHPVTGECCPVTMGHEFSGEIVEVGEGVNDLKVGDRVAVEPIIWDDTCTSCGINAHNCCDGGGFIGLSGWGGGLSEFCVVPAASCYPLPDNVSYEAGALVEPLAVGWHAVSASPLKKGDTVMVLGGGPIGLSVIQALKAQGAGTVIVSEIANKRKEFATHFGADYLIDPSKEDVVKRAKELSGGDGPTIVYDAAGVQEGLDTAIDSLMPRGTLLNIALWEGTATIRPTQMLLKEKRWQGVVTYARATKDKEADFRQVLNAISEGSMKPLTMITKKIKLKDVVKEGFESLRDDKGNQVKILVDPSAA